MLGYNIEVFFASLLLNYLYILTEAINLPHIVHSLTFDINSALSPNQLVLSLIVLLSLLK